MSQEPLPPFLGVNPTNGLTKSENDGGSSLDIMVQESPSREVSVMLLFCSRDGQYGYGNLVLRYYVVPWSGHGRVGGSDRNRHCAGIIGAPLRK